MKIQRLPTSQPHICGVQMLPAGEGDCFFLQLLLESGVFRMLIDCGTPGSWDNGLKPLLNRLSKQNIRINILIISHIDSDHIGGAIKFFKDNILREMVDEVWYNGLRHIIPASASVPLSTDDIGVFSKISARYKITDDISNGSISTTQSEMLSGLLDKANTAWNRHSRGEAILESTPTLIITPDIRIDFLLPTENALLNLFQKFRIELNKQRMGAEIALIPESERAFELSNYCELVTEMFSEPISSETLTLDDIPIWAESVPQKDKSITNASSIAFCISYYGKQMLFTGDSSSDELVSALGSWREITGKPLFFDVVKLPHHGSACNCMNFLDYVDGINFFISTNGEKHGHPDKETLAKIVSRPTDSTRNLIFNYETDSYRLFSNAESEAKYNYSVKVQTDMIYI